MRDLLAQIDAGLDSGLYYLSLYVALAVPDICGAIDSQDGEATRQKYVAWFDKYVAPEYQSPMHGPMLTGQDCYHFRCALLHQGSSQHPKSTYSRVLFVEPSATTPVLHCNVLNDAFNIDVRIFCRDIIKGAETWLKQIEGTAVYEKNSVRFMQRYPNGLPPYISGVPVIG